MLLLVIKAILATIILSPVLTGLFSGWFLSNNLENSQNYLVTIRDDSFYPRFIKLKEGDSVTFENKSDVDHWPASNIHPTHEIYPEFDPKQAIKPDQPWKFKFLNIGEWRFHDHLNATVSGEVVVEPRVSSSMGEVKNLLYQNNDRIIFLKTWLLDKIFSLYFKLYPQEKEKYLSSQDIRRIFDKTDNLQLGLLIKLFGPEAIMKQLFEQSDRGKNYNCHTPAHQVGRIAYKVLGDTALIYNISLCASGYNHGVMAAFVNGLDQQEVVSRINEKCGVLEPLYLRINCFHGVGHGLMAYYDYDLPKAIESCKNLGELYRTGNCLVGAFMENIGTQFGDSLNIHDSKWVDRNDPHFPCDKIDQAYQVQRTCYSIQTGWMTYLFNKDVKRTIAACLEVNEKVISDCFFGYGQTAGLMANYNPGMAVSLCQMVPDKETYRDSCFTGALIDTIFFWGPQLGNKGEVFCKTVPIKNQEVCMNFLEGRRQNFFH